MTRDRSAVTHDRWTRAIVEFGDSFVAGIETFYDELDEDVSDHPIGGRVGALLILPPIIAVSAMIAFADAWWELRRDVRPRDRRGRFTRSGGPR